jgi:hypothetical protein
MGDVKTQQVGDKKKAKGQEVKEVMERDNNLLTNCAIYPARTTHTRARAHTRGWGRKRSIGLVPS